MWLDENVVVTDELGAFCKSEAEKLLCGEDEFSLLEQYLSPSESLEAFRASAKFFAKATRTVAEDREARAKDPLTVAVQ